MLTNHKLKEKLKELPDVELNEETDAIRYPEAYADMIDELLEENRKTNRNISIIKISIIFVIIAIIVVITVTT